MKRGSKKKLENAGMERKICRKEDICYKELMKIALIQTNPTIGDFAGNVNHMIDCAEQARKTGCELVVFPELSISGYPPRDYLDHEAFLAAQEEALSNFIYNTHGIAVLCGAISRHTGSTGKPLHNSAVLFEDGNILFSSHKRLLPTYDVFDEVRYFEPGRSSSAFPFKGVQLGITICEDIFNDSEGVPHPLYDENPVADLTATGPVDLLINIAASPYTLGKQKLREKVFSTLCRKYTVPLLYVNQGMAINAAGQRCYQAASFQEEILIVDTEQWQPMEDDLPDETKNVFQALAMGIRDYVAKCGFSQVLLGLSGGIDSALSCALACEALGVDNVMGVALPSPYSSQGSVDDARALAENLGIRFEIISINDAFASLKQTLAPLFADLPEDVTEQNIQARIRGNLLMAMANKFGRLLLATGNKSEMAVGYCTLYGDMCGALSPLADAPKTLVYKLARYVNKNGELIPWSSIEKAPSAELAPNQTDQDDLPPYDILDPILQAYLEEHRSIKDIVAMGYDQNIVKDVIRRIRINEYKRQQAALGLKVTSKAFGYGRRYPITEKFQEF
jgi:NAD+ synthetase